MTGGAKIGSILGTAFASMTAIGLQEIAKDPTVDKTAIMIAGIGLAGLFITAVFTFIIQFLTLQAQRDGAKEARVAAAENVKAQAQIHTAVNSTATAQVAEIKRLNEEISRMAAAIAQKDEAASQKKT